MRSAVRQGRLSRVRAWWAALGRGQRATLAVVFTVVTALHVAGFVTLLALVAPYRYRLGTAGAFTVGIGLTAYTLGLRHAFDADHISAIDNTTRKLMSEGKRPLSVGFWFSLGHSTIVFALAFLLSIGVRSLTGPIKNDNSGLHQVTSWIGTLVSGSFLYVIAALNLVGLVGIVRVFRAMRAGGYDEAALEAHLNNRGLMNRFLGRITRRSSGRARCTRSASSLASVSTPPPRSRCSCWRAAQPAPACRGTRFSACRSCSPPACRYWTRSTDRS
jgi:high-affinity nickel-transport protein